MDLVNRRGVSLGTVCVWLFFDLLLQLVDDSKNNINGPAVIEAGVESEAKDQIVVDSAPYAVEFSFTKIGDNEVPQVCYALAHNRISILRSLKIRITGSSAAKKLTIKVRSEWAVNNRSPFKETEFTLDAPTTVAAIEIAPVDQVQLSDVALVDLEEKVPATLILELTDDLGRHQVVRQDVDVFARDQWLAAKDYRVITAAFVQPNHPDVNRVLKLAGEILKAAGHPGISGYQGVSSGQHHRIAEAIFKALQTFVTIYINPPASFETIGQKLRPIDRVLDEKAGTCIDLACAYASCLEQAGLHPIIYLVSGHAFAGYIAKEQHLPAPVIEEWSAIQSLIDSKLLVAVETVCITDGKTFEEAVSRTQENLVERDIEGQIQMRAIIDVALAHVQGILPLPARVLRDNVITVVIDNGPKSPPVIERRDATTRKLLPESVPARVQAWKNSLLDLSFRNRLLNLRPDRYGLKLMLPVGHLGEIEDRLNNEEVLKLLGLGGLNSVQIEVYQRGGPQGDEVIDGLFNAGQLLVPVDAARFKPLVSRLKSEAGLQEEESGANCLYLVVGTVKWGAKYGDYESPLFLIPIRIRGLRGLNIAEIQMDSTQSTTVNYCLIEALRLREQLTLQWFSDDMSDDLGLDIEAGLEELRKEFRDKGLDVAGFSVNQSVHIAVLDFKKFRLWKDLSDHWKEFTENSAVKHLVETPRETFQDPAAKNLESLVVNDASVMCAQSADGSQINAIERALAGSSFVLQGPPGSGKSQTITNLLANAMYRGKKVLFVAEKQSALQEVQERLEEVMLWPYCLSLHDSDTKPEELRTQLRDALEQKPSISEKTHETNEDEFAATAKHLDNYRRNVYEPNRAGFSFANAYFRLGELGDGPIAQVARPFLDFEKDKVEMLRRGLLNLDDLTRPARVSKQHPWCIAGPVSFEALDRAELSKELAAVLATCKELTSIASRPISEFQSTIISITSLEMLADVLYLREIQEMPSTSDWQSIAKGNWATNVHAVLNDLANELLSVSSLVAGKETFLRRTDLNAALPEIAEAADSFAIGRKKRLRQALGPFLEVIDHEGLEPDAIAEAVIKIAHVAGRLQVLCESLKSMNGLNFLLAEVPVTELDIFALRKRVTVLTRIALGLSDVGTSGAALRELVSSQEMAVPGISEKFYVAVSAISVLANRLKSSDESVARWSAESGIVSAASERSREAWEEAMRSGNFLSLQRWLNLQEYLTEYRSAGLIEMASAIEDGTLVAEDAPKAFERGLLITTIEVRAEETNLDVFDSAAQNRRVKAFITALNDRKERAQKAIPYYLFKARKISAGVTTGKVGDFRREINSPSKRRRGRSIRHLIERYPEIISDLVPCFLMSPDSVAQFLPPGSIKFDIVVFDEASQIMVADAIGSIGRSASCVIVGDSKQMPPTKIGAVDTSEDENTSDLIEDVADIEDEESILDEAVRAGFHQELLTWHYRSQDESLIAFSNENYYDSRLSTFPSPVEFRSDCGVFYRRVEGQFDHGKSRTNLIEAKAIVEEIIKRLDDPTTANLSYGVVTLNIQQRNLIGDLLDQNDDARIREMRETDDKKKRLFVLNLENVQGRERDVIIMGTAFSKRVGGGSLPLNFGPITNKGGERRLNVAVTRAKRQFVVVSSFDPEEMAGAKTLGMIHLREYLKTARRRSVRSEVETSRYETTPYVELIAKRLEERGIKVQLGKGLSKFKIDMALTLPEMGDSWLVAALFDSEEWSHRPLAIDRDALPVTVLEKVMKWRSVVRVWMPAIRLELDEVINELVEYVHVAKNMPELSIAPPPPSPKLKESDDLAPASSSNQAKSRLLPSELRDVSPKKEDVEVLAGEITFAEFSFPSVNYGPDSLLTTYAQGLLASLADAEGPMLAFEAIKRVAREFGLQRVTNQRLSTLTPLLAIRQVTEVVEGMYVVWPTGTDPVTWKGFRRTTVDVRKLENITPYEIVNAMAITVRRSITISSEELIKWTAQFFGSGRVTAKQSEYLSLCIKWALDGGRFLQVEGGLTSAHEE